MSDPILNKLKHDASIVLVDLWRALRHEVPVENEEWEHPRVKQATTEEPVQRPSRDGLCYFHLN